MKKSTFIKKELAIYLGELFNPDDLPKLPYDKSSLEYKQSMNNFTPEYKKLIEEKAQAILKYLIVLEDKYYQWRKKNNKNIKENNKRQLRKVINSITPIKSRMPPIILMRIRKKK